MDLLAKEKRDFQDLLVKGGVLKTITALKDFVHETSEKYKTLLLIEGHFRQLERNNQEGVISHQDLYLEANKTRKNILELIGDLTKEDTLVRVQSIPLNAPSAEISAPVQTDKNQNRIFLCHAKEDKKQVLSIYEKLEALGFNPWLDKKNLLPGQNWQREIPRALKAARFILIFFSKHSVSKRGYVQREFKLALDVLAEVPEDQIFIIPVRLDDCTIPENFQHIQYVDLFEAGSFDLVVKVIGMEVGQASMLEVQELPPTPPNQFTDPRDGRTYKTVHLLGKTWLAENLNYDIGEGCWVHNHAPVNGEKYGRLYTWDAAKKACPPGWRLPTDEEWKALAKHYGGYNDFLLGKEIGSRKKGYAQLIKDGQSGFDALLGGSRGPDGSFSDLGANGFCWSATERGGGTAFYYYFYSDNQILGRNGIGREFGFSVRCLQD